MTHVPGTLAMLAYRELKGSSVCVFGGFWETPFGSKTTTSHL